MEKIGKLFACIESNITVDCNDGKFVYANIKGGVSSGDNCTYSDGDCTGDLIQLGASKLDDCIRARETVCVVTVTNFGRIIPECAKATYFYLEDTVCTKGDAISS